MLYRILIFVCLRYYYFIISLFFFLSVTEKSMYMMTF